MTKLVSRIATGIAIIGLAAPAFAATTSGSATVAPATRTSPLHHGRSHKHKKVAAKSAAKAEMPAAPDAAAPASK